MNDRVKVALRSSISGGGGGGGGSDHKKVICSCGAVIMQCRCFNHAKSTEVRQEGCAACIARKAVQLQQVPRSGL